MTLFMWIATAAWLSLVLGYQFRRIRRLHLLFVLSGIFADLSLVLYLQFTRSAIQTAVSFTLSLWEQIHIAFSTLALLCYFPTLFFGILILTNGPTVRTLSLHRTFALSALTLRTLGFLFMFSMWKD